MDSDNRKDEYFKLGNENGKSSFDIPKKYDNPNKENLQVMNSQSEDVKPKKTASSMSKESLSLKHKEKPYHTYEHSMRGDRRTSAIFHENSEAGYYKGPDPQNYNSKNSIFIKC